MPGSAWTVQNRHAWGAEDELWQGAAQRIEKYRKSDAVLVLVNKAGKPLPDVKVTVEQTRHQFLFGCNFFMYGKAGNQPYEDAYRTQFADLFNYATLAFYWPSYESRQGQPQHAYTEDAAKWCRDHGITTKGHPLAWNYFEPRWLPDDLQEVRRLQMERITDCVTRFRGLIDIWDVVNEATHYEREELQQRAPKMTKMWTEVGRVPFVNECFERARSANEHATLLINDYRVDPAYVQLIKDMTQQAGRRPYDVIGLQSHMHGGVWTNEKIWEVCELFAPFDVPLHFTELTVLSGVPGWERARKASRGHRPPKEKLNRQKTWPAFTPCCSPIRRWLPSPGGTSLTETPGSGPRRDSWVKTCDLNRLILHSRIWSSINGGLAGVDDRCRGPCGVPRLPGGLQADRAIGLGEGHRGHLCSQQWPGWRHTDRRGYGELAMSRFGSASWFRSACGALAILPLVSWVGCTGRGWTTGGRPAVGQRARSWRTGRSTKTREASFTTRRLTPLVT